MLTRNQTNKRVQLLGPEYDLRTGVLLLVGSGRESHIAAKNKAIDYYRKYTRREVKDGDEGLSLDQLEDKAASIEELVDFQRLFDKVVKQLPR